MRRIIILFSVALLLAMGSCKKVTTECMFIVRPLTQVASGGAFATSTGVIAYGFYADTAQWEVSSYANARAGLISNRINKSQTQKYDFFVEQDANTRLNIGPFSRPKAIVVACDTVNRFYGWRHCEIIADMPSVLVPVRFMLWQDTTNYVDSKWFMVNEFYVPKPEPEPEPEPEPDPEPEPEPGA